MIEVRGPNVFKGYWRMPEKTKAEFREDGFFISGDLGYVDPRGYVYISGRGKDLIISGGFNVYPAEVEGAIEALPGVAECAVIGVPHADFGEGVVAVVTGQAGRGARREADDHGARRRTGQIQAAEANLRRREPAAERDGQGAEERAARTPSGRLCNLANPLKVGHNAAMQHAPERGNPFPLGATPLQGGVNLAVFSAHAERLDLCLFDASGDRQTACLAFPDATDAVFHGFFPGLTIGQVYGLRAHGSWAPGAGPSLQPAPAAAGPLRQGHRRAVRLVGSQSGRPCRPAAFRSARYRRDRPQGSGSGA